MPKIIQNLNVDITCRSCLTESDALSSLYSVAENANNSISLGDIMSKLFKVKLTNIIDLPTKICDACQHDLITAYNFQLKTEESETALQEYLRRNNLNGNPEQITVEADYGFIRIKAEEKDFEEDFFEEKQNFSLDGYVDNNDLAELDVEDDDDEDYVADEEVEQENENVRPSKTIRRRHRGKFPCDQCSSKFSTQSQLNQHKKVHSTETPTRFYCSTCNKCFVNNRNLQRHLKIHLKTEQKNDEEGNSVDNNDTEMNNEDSKDKDDKKQTENQLKEDLKLDLKIFKPDTKLKITVEKNFCCDHCSAKFSNQSQLNCHKKAHSGKNFFCEPCDRYFVNNRNLQRHLKLHYGQIDNKFKCSHCDKTFETKLRWKLHERSHNMTNKIELEIDGIDLDKNSCLPNETKSLECKICNSKFNKICLLRHHIVTHSQEDTIDPIFLQNSYYLKNLLPGAADDILSLTAYIIDEVRNGHLQKFYSGTNMVGNELHFSDSETDTDTEERKMQLVTRIYTCEVCQEIFDRRYKILNHQRTNHTLDDHKYECPTCSMRYVSIDLLDYHTKTQCKNEEKQFTCDVCKMKFMWKENIEQHIRIHHTKASKTPLKLIRKYSSKGKLDCEICHKKFSRPEHLERHMRTHNPAEKKFECGTCKKKFSRKDNLRCHMKVHDENRSDINDESKHFLCVFCGRKFRNSSNLVVHTRRHTGEKPFKCDFCDKGFPRSSDLRTHRRTHTGEKPHLCITCGKGFSRSNKLTRHMRIHTGDRPYKCTYCDRAFTQSNDLTIHVRRHTGEKPYTCGICGERFIQGTALQTHRKTRGHFEDIEGIDVPFAHLSQNNPNPLNNAGRVDQIGVPKANSGKQSSTSIQRDEKDLISPSQILTHQQQQHQQQLQMLQQQVDRNPADDIIGFNYKDISSFVQAHHYVPHHLTGHHPLGLPLLPPPPPDLHSNHHDVSSSPVMYGLSAPPSNSSYSHDSNSNV